jgi:hypothetical protein
MFPVALLREEGYSEKRRQQGSNLRGRSPTDFKSVSLTTRTYRRFCLNSLLNKKYCF